MGLFFWGVVRRWRWLMEWKSPHFCFGASKNIHFSEQIHRRLIVSQFALRKCRNEWCCSGSVNWWTNKQPGQKNNPKAHTDTIWCVLFAWRHLSGHWNLKLERYMYGNENKWMEHTHTQEIFLVICHNLCLGNSAPSSFDNKMEINQIKNRNTKKNKKQKTVEIIIIFFSTDETKSNIKMNSTARSADQGFDLCWEKLDSPKGNSLLL